MVTQNRQGLYKIDTVTGIFNECFPLIKVKVFSRDPPYIIEIINNTREGIVMFIQAKKGNASNGGQKIQMLK